MLLSMTGFGKGVAEVGNKKISVEIKSLNSKQLDLSIRVPALFRENELDIRTRIAKVLERGKVETIVFVENLGDDTAPSISQASITAYYNQITSISRNLGIPEPTDWFSVLLRLPEIIHSDAPTNAAESEVAALMNATDAAITALMQHRRSEGEKLEEFFSKRIDKISEFLNEVPKYESMRVAKIRARIEDNLAKIPATEIDRGRLEQEMIYYIEKLDINEEKQRLAQHLRYFIETLNAPYGQGKKLGFISQEMGREINTLGSKSNHAEMQQLVVMMKDELEQIKEQVLNVM